MENVVQQAEALVVVPSSPVHGSRKHLSKNKTLCWTEEVHMQEKRRTGRHDPRTGKSRLACKKKPRADRSSNQGGSPQKQNKTKASSRDPPATALTSPRPFAWPHVGTSSLLPKKLRFKPRLSHPSEGPLNTWRAQAISSDWGAPCWIMIVVVAGAAPPPTFFGMTSEPLMQHPIFG